VSKHAGYRAGRKWVGVGSLRGRTGSQNTGNLGENARIVIIVVPSVVYRGAVLTTLGTTISEIWVFFDLVNTKPAIIWWLSLPTS